MPRGVPKSKSLPAPSTTETGRIQVATENKSNTPKEDMRLGTVDVNAAVDEASNSPIVDEVIQHLEENVVEVTVVSKPEGDSVSYKTRGTEGNKAFAENPDVIVLDSLAMLPVKKETEEISDPGAVSTPVDLSRIDAKNYFNVRPYGKRDIIVLRAISRMSYEEGLAFAAHIVSIADPLNKEFPLYLKKIREV